MAEQKPFIPYADRAGVPEKLRAPLEAYEKRMGFMPNALKLYMHRPELLGCLVNLNNTVMRDESSQLDVGLKRRISAICSFLNKSAYCLAHNTNTLMAQDSSVNEGWNFSEEDVAMLLSASYAPKDPAEKAAIEYAKAASSDHSNVPQSVLENLAATMTPPEIIELACVVGFWAMYNSIHEALHIPIEDELVGRACFLEP